MNSLARTHPLPDSNASVDGFNRLDRSPKFDQGVRTSPLSARSLMGSDRGIPRMTCHNILIWYDQFYKDMYVAPCMTCCNGTIHIY